MLNIPTTEVISMQFNILVFYILFAFFVGMSAGFEIKSLVLKYCIVKREATTQAVN